MPEILGITISFFCRVLSPCYLFNKYWTVTCNYSFIISFPFQFLNPAASMPWVISELTKMNFLPHAFACCTWWILNAFLIWLLLSTKEKLQHFSRWMRVQSGRVRTWTSGLEPSTSFLELDPSPIRLSCSFSSPQFNTSCSLFMWVSFCLAC